MIKPCRAIKVEKINNIVKKYYSLDIRKGKNKEQWTEELLHEVNILNHLKDCTFVPKVLNYSLDDNYIELSYCGEAIELIEEEKNYKNVLKIKEYENILKNKYNIYHNDVKWKNICILDNKIFLIDFGSSSFDKPLPHPVEGIYTYLDLKYNDKKNIINEALVEIPKNIISHGGKIPYYGLQIEDKYFKGIRDWDERWSMLSDIIDFNNKKILEIGCNSGLLSIYIKKYKNALKCTGFDGCKNIIKSANLLALYHNVDIEFKNLIIGTETRSNTKGITNWENLIGYDFDIVTCLSFYRWIKNDERKQLINYLINFKTIIFENHDNHDKIEDVKKIFSNTGYSNKIIKLSDHKDYYDRTLIIFNKD